jgi:hypothetical protein
MAARRPALGPGLMKHRVPQRTRQRARPLHMTLFHHAFLRASSLVSVAVTRTVEVRELLLGGRGGEDVGRSCVAGQMACPVLGNNGTNAAGGIVAGCAIRCGVASAIRYL